MIIKDCLNIGCGCKTFKNAINLDHVHEVGIVDSDIIADGIVLPFKDESFKCVYSSHSFEHLSRKQHSVAIKEWRRVLIDGGKLMIAVPNFELCLKNFLENYHGMKEYWYMTIFGADRYEGDQHLSGVTELYLSDLLFSFGFVSLEWKRTDRYYSSMGVKATKTELPNERI